MYITYRKVENISESEKGGVLVRDSSLLGLRFAREGDRAIERAREGTGSSDR